MQNNTHDPKSDLTSAKYKGQNHRKVSNSFQEESKFLIKT